MMLVGRIAVGDEVEGAGRETLLDASVSVLAQMVEDR